MVMRVDRPARHSSRYENKYAVSGNLARQILERARLFLSPDRGVDVPQYISTLYLETPDLTFYQWHNDRRSDRFKLRIRGYGQPPGGSVYVEIKGKNGKLSHKSRAKVALAKLNRVLCAIKPAPSLPLREFITVHHELNAGPKVLVRCVR